LFYQWFALFIFFCEKENEPKEIAPVMLFPARLKALGRCETRCAQTVTAPLSTAFVMLGA